MLVLWTVVVRIRTEHVPCCSVYSVHTHQLLSLKTKYQQNNFSIVPSIITLSKVYPLLATKISRSSPLQKLLWKSLSMEKNIEKIVVVVKKVVMCKDDNCFFRSFSCGVKDCQLRLTSLFIMLNCWLCSRDWVTLTLRVCWNLTYQRVDINIKSFGVSEVRIYSTFM